MAAFSRFRRNFARHHGHEATWARAALLGGVIMRRRVGLLIVVVGMVFGARFAYSWNQTMGATQGSVPILIGGITGPCGYLSGRVAGGTSAEAVYGHDVSGTCCPLLSDHKVVPNFLTATFVESNGGHYLITATSTLSLGAYANGAKHANEKCPVGGPAFNYAGTSTVMLSMPAKGAGGSPHTSGADSTPLGVPSYGSNPPSPTPQSGGPIVIPWDVDPQDATTHTVLISAKVDTEFNGTASDCICTNDKHSAKCKLDVTITGPH